MDKRRRATVFDGQRFLKENFLRPQNVLAMFRIYDVASPSLSAVEKWFQRGTIPGEHFPVLLALLEIERGGPVGVSGYLTGGRE